MTTMKKLAPTLGTTAPALRASLASAGLHDLRLNRPTRLAHELGCVFYRELRKDGEHLRFPVWRRDRLLEVAPALAPSEDDVLRSFGSRWAAADAMRQAALSLREEIPALADQLAPFASDATKAAIHDQTSAAARMAWARDALAPARLALAAAMGKGPHSDAAETQLRALDGAIHWISTPVRSRVNELPTIRRRPERAPERAARRFDDAHSFAISDGERVALETGYTFNGNGAQKGDGDFAAAALVPLAALLDPDAGPRQHARAARQPLRALRFGRRLALGTVAPLGGDMLLASAHKCDLVGSRLSVQTEIAAYAVAHADGTIADQEGDEPTRAWLRRLVGDQAALRKDDGDE